jgi:hypothetical protein
VWRVSGHLPYYATPCTPKFPGGARIGSEDAKRGWPKSKLTANRLDLSRFGTSIDTRVKSVWGALNSVLQGISAHLLRVALRKLFEIQPGIGRSKSPPEQAARSRCLALIRTGGSMVDAAGTALAESAGESQLHRVISWKDAFWVVSGVPALVLFSIGGVAATVGTGAGVDLVGHLRFYPGLHLWEIAGLFPNKSGGVAIYGAAAWVRYSKFIAPLSVSRDRRCHRDTRTTSCRNRGGLGRELKIATGSSRTSALER